MDQICPRSVFPIEIRKNKHLHLTLHIRICLGTKFQFKLAILIFWTKFAQKGYFQSKTEKINIAIEIWIFELVKVKHFSLKWHFWCFGPNFPKTLFPVENKKSEHYHWFQDIRIRVGTKCPLKLTISIF